MDWRRVLGQQPTSLSLSVFLQPDLFLVAHPALHPLAPGTYAPSLPCLEICTGRSAWGLGVPAPEAQAGRGECHRLMHHILHLALEDLLAQGLSCHLDSPLGPPSTCTLCHSSRACAHFVPGSASLLFWLTAPTFLQRMPFYLLRSYSHLVQVG